MRALAVSGEPDVKGRRRLTLIALLIVSCGGKAANILDHPFLPNLIELLQGEKRRAVQGQTF